MERISTDFLETSSSKVNERSLNLLFKAFFSSNQKPTLKERLFDVVRIIRQTSQTEKKALLYAGRQFFVVFVQDNRHNQDQRIEDFCTRQTFLRFFSLPEQITYRSKWLSLAMSLIFIYSVWIFYHNPELTLLVFGAHYSLSILIAFILTLKAWIKRNHKLSYDYLPRLLSIASLLVINLSQNILRVLPTLLSKSLIIFILIWVGHFFYQGYKIRKHLPQLSGALFRLTILALLIDGMLYQFSTVVHFLIEKAILLLLLYKCIKLIIICFRKFR